MRRANREITDPAKINEILKKSRYMHVAMCDGDQPYVIPMHYGYDFDGKNLTLYAHCAHEGRKLDILAKNPKVCIEIDRGEELVASPDGTACGYGAKYECIVANGKVELLQDIEEKRAALINFMKVQTGHDFEIPDAGAASVEVLKIVATDFTCKAKYDGL